MAKGKISFILIIFILALSCDANDPKPPQEKPPGYQKDIDWPSLAVSPWASNKKDQQNSGRVGEIYSPVINGQIYKIVSNVNVVTGVVFDNDGNLYFGVENSYGDSIHLGGVRSYNKAGTLNWDYKLNIIGESISTPIITNRSEVVFAAGHEGEVYCLNNKGELKWKTKLGGVVFQTGICIDLDGNFYVLTLNYPSDNYKLSVITKSGNLLWELESEEFQGGYLFGMAFSVDAKILFIPGKVSAIIALDIIKQEIAWEFGVRAGDFSSYPLVDSDNRLYTMSETEDSEGKLFCLSAEGEVVWETYLDSMRNRLSFVGNCTNYSINKKGELFTAWYNLYSISNSGEKRWQVDLKGIATSPISIGANEIYLVIRRGAQSYLCSYTYEGHELFAIEMEGFDYYFPPTISDNGIFLPSTRNNLITKIR